MEQTTTKQCYGVHSDCNEDATTIVTSQKGKEYAMCDECTEEYNNYLLSIGWAKKTKLS